MPNTLSASAEKVRRAVHRTVAAVSGDLDRFHFNKAVARIRELTNLLEEIDDEGDGWVLREGLETVARLIGPMMPHLAEEVWHRLGHQTLLADTPWPEVDPALLVEDSVTIAVQVNGKLRGEVDLPKETDRETAEAAALALPGVIKAVGAGPIRKVIVVPNRIINVVV